MNNKSCVQWYILVIPVFRKLIQEDWESKPASGTLTSCQPINKQERKILRLQKDVMDVLETGGEGNIRDQVMCGRVDGG